MWFHSRVSEQVLFRMTHLIQAKAIHSRVSEQRVRFHSRVSEQVTLKPRWHSRYHRGAINSNAVHGGMSDRQARREARPHIYVVHGAAAFSAMHSCGGAALVTSFPSPGPRTLLPSLAATGRLWWSGPDCPPGLVLAALSRWIEWCADTPSVEASFAWTNSIDDDI